MRTTLSLDDDVFELVRSYAENRSLAIGKAVSELVRRGLTAPVKTRVVNGLVVFDVPQSTDPVTSELVKRLEAEEWGHVAHPWSAFCANHFCARA